MPSTLDSTVPFFSTAQLKTLHEQGYLVVPDLLSIEAVEAGRLALRQLIEQAADAPEQMEWRLPAESGKSATIRGKNSPLMIETEAGWDPRGQTAEEIDRHVRKFMGFQNEHPWFSSILAETEPIRRAISTILGEAPILFQDMALVKPARIGREKPWHQDNAYFSVTPLEAVVGVWIALDDADIENGCMHVIPGGHRGGGLKHHHTFDCEIVPDRLDPADAVPIPVPAGGALFFYGLLPHQTPPNRSDKRRRALQFHYRSADSQVVDKSFYDKVFCEPDGTPASCKAARESS